MFKNIFQSKKMGCYHLPRKIVVSHLEVLFDTKHNQSSLSDNKSLPCEQRSLRSAKLQNTGPFDLPRKALLDIFSGKIEGTSAQKVTSLKPFFQISSESFQARLYVFVNKYAFFLGHDSIGRENKT